MIKWRGADWTLQMFQELKLLSAVTDCVVVVVCPSYLLGAS